MIQLDTFTSNHLLSIDPNHRQNFRLEGEIAIPGDKSISHRSLMLGALALGTTTIRGLLLGEDPRSTAKCFQAMGAEISELNSELVTVQGIGLGNLQEPSDILDAGNSGTTLRLMLGVLASHDRRFFTVTGDKSLQSRPMLRVVKPLREMGAQIWGREDGGKAPLAISGQNLKPIHYHSPIASAQVKSCILLAGLMIDGETIITEPERSRDHSERMLSAFGAKIEVDGNTVCLKGRSQLHGQEVIVPGDISSAAYWLVAGAIVPDADLLILNVGVNPTRTGILEVLLEMGADITLENPREVTGEPVADLRVRSSQLKACSISGAIIPRLIDEIPILAVAASLAEGTTIIRDAAELRVKESDRITVTAKCLNQMGANITELSDGMEIKGGCSLVGAEVDSCDDHRIAMSMAIAALVAKGKTVISHAECAAISYPSFIPTLQKLF